MNKEKFRALLATHGHTYKHVADLLEITEQSVVNKVNETKSEFKLSEIKKISYFYNLDSEQLKAIFFDLKVS